MENIPAAFTGKSAKRKRCHTGKLLWMIDTGKGHNYLNNLLFHPGIIVLSFFFHDFREMGLSLTVKVRTRTHKVHSMQYDVLTWSAQAGRGLQM